MSAFIVNRATLDRAVACLAECEHGLANSAIENRDQIGRELWKLNREAVACRYGADDGEPCDAEIASYTYHPPRSACYARMGYLCDILKGAQCMLYQCAEGKIPETSVLFDRLTKATRVVAFRIVECLPDYKNAAWDADLSATVNGKGVA